MNYGKVTKLNAWKNRLGYFVGIGETDYMYYGQPDVKINDEVEFVTGEPAKDGKPTLMTLHRIPIETEPIAPSKEAKQYVEEVKAKYQPTDKDATITRLACIKAACELLQGSPSQDRAADVIEIARRLEKYAKEG
jgi:hypothetical protein